MIDIARHSETAYQVRYLLSALWRRLGRRAPSRSGSRTRPARIGQKGRVGHRWCSRGVRPPGRCDQRFSSTDLFAAARPGHDEALALVLPEATTATMNLFLDGFGRRLGAGGHAAVLVLDRAGWHTSGAPVVPDNVTLPPPAALFARARSRRARLAVFAGRCLSHRWHDGYDVVVEAACAAWTALRTEAGRLASLTAFQCVTN